MAMTPTKHRRATEAELDILAWRFLRSQFTDQIYADWPIERRLDAFLLHDGPTGLLIDGSAYNDLLEHVMTNIGPAIRNGVLSP